MAISALGNAVATSERTLLLEESTVTEMWRAFVMERNDWILTSRQRTDACPESSSQRSQNSLLEDSHVPGLFTFMRCEPLSSSSSSSLTSSQRSHDREHLRDSSAPIDERPANLLAIVYANVGWVQRAVNSLQYMYSSKHVPVKDYCTPRLLSLCNTTNSALTFYDCLD